MPFVKVKNKKPPVKVGVKGQLFSLVIGHFANYDVCYWLTAFNKQCKESLVSNPI